MRDPIPPTVEWRRGRVRLIDQRALPGGCGSSSARRSTSSCDAIRDPGGRGAPALGAAGAFGVALAARTIADESAQCGRAAAPDRGRPPHRRRTCAWGVERALAACEHGGR